MKARQVLCRCAAVIIAAAAILLVSSNVLLGSDFPRYIYEAPPQSANQWDSLQALGANLIWNYRGNWNNLGNYMNSLETHGMQSVLRNSSFWPYRVEYYSQAQYMQYQVEVNYDEALLTWESPGTGYYFFIQTQGQDSLDLPPGGASRFLDESSDDPGWVIDGPKFTGVPSGPGLYGEWIPDLNEHIDTLGYRIYRHRISLAADIDGLVDTTQVFTLNLQYKHDQTSWTDSAALIIKTAADFNGQSQTFMEFYVEDTIFVSEEVVLINYKLHWPGNCDIWVDWIETMDLPRGYNLFWSSASQNATLDSIYDECYALEQDYPDALANWAQSDTPKRLNFTAHGTVNNYMRSHNLRSTLTPFGRDSSQYQRGDHFIVTGRPQILDVYNYRLMENNSVGNQTELDTIASDLEMGFQACADTLEMRYLCQGHSNETDSIRDPLPSELSVQAYMALAHGAKGIGYYGYVSDWDDLGNQIQIGLVDEDYAHCATPYAEKWLAVQAVFNQLDSLGNTLLSLDRYASYCAIDNGFVSPVDSVYFEDDDYDYIEVGQFHDAANADYLIIVNRRTDFDRHISVVTNLSGRYALRDLYTQEKFVSSTGNFEWIPFAAGQGRVFKLERYIAESQVQNITFDR